MRSRRSMPSSRPGGVKYDKAVECLVKDRDALLAFYDFPAEHWKHLRTTDEIDKRFFHGRATIAEIDVRPFFCSVALRAILPSRPPISQPPRAGAVKAGRICGHRMAWP